MYLPCEFVRPFENSSWANPAGSAGWQCGHLKLAVDEIAPFARSYVQAYESTDDAQLDGHGDSLSCHIDGTVIAVHAEDVEPGRIKRRGVELRLILDGHVHRPPQVESALLKALARTRVWFDEVVSGRIASLAEVVRREGLRKRYVTRLTKLAFVAPEIAEAVAAGRIPVGVKLQMLMDGRLELAPCWSEQQRMFSAAAR
jgi:hypothetical protein